MNPSQHPPLDQAASTPDGDAPARATSDPSRRAGRRDRSERGTRTGFSTGACSAAAARACALGLIQGQVPDSVESLLANGQRVSFAIHDGHIEGEGLARCWPAT